MFDLKGKTALVTGATGGIGGAIARSLHAQGATVAISGTKLEKLEQLKAELGERVFALPCDLGDRAAVQALPGQADAAMGRIDILVNNAGVTKDNLFMLLKDDDWDRIINVNLTSCFTLCRATVRGMIKRRAGRIINISSVSAILGNPGQANYSASKAGMIAMTKSIAREVAPRNITANCIAPGFVKTAMTEVLTEKQLAMASEMIPAQRFGDASEIAAAAVFLASDEAAYITGQTLHVNGGLAMI